MSFKQNLHNELEYQNIIVKELAARCGLSKHTIDNYLTGHNSLPKADTAVKIAQALNVSVEYLVTGKNSGTEEMFSGTIRRILEKIKQFDERDIQTVYDLVSSLARKYSE